MGEAKRKVQKGKGKTPAATSKTTLMPLNMPFVHQNHETRCGAAVLEMTLRYFGVTVDQDEIYKRLAKPDPTKPGAEHIEIGQLLREARAHGFYASAGKTQINDLSRMVSEIGFFVYRKKIPLIACQRFSLGDPSTHFRVIIGLDNYGGIIVHDPSRNGGGEALRFDPLLFSQLWSAGGKITDPGPSFYISKEEIPELKSKLPSLG